MTQPQFPDFPVSNSERSRRLYPIRRIHIGQKEKALERGQYSGVDDIVEWIEYFEWSGAIILTYKVPI